MACQPSGKLTTYASNTYLPADRNLLSFHEAYDFEWPHSTAHLTNVHAILLSKLILQPLLLLKTFLTSLQGFSQCVQIQFTMQRSCVTQPIKRQFKIFQVTSMFDHFTECALSGDTLTHYFTKFISVLHEYLNNKLLNEYFIL